MDRTGLIARVAETGSCTKKLAEDVVDNVINAITYGLVTDGKVLLTGWGRLKTTKRAARQGVNPKTGEAIDIPESIVINFKAGEKLKAAVVAAKKAAKPVAKKVVKKVVKSKK